jgi:DNA-binding transcriptional LysR family regulator
MRIDLPGIEAFLSIAHWGSFKRAAGHLNLSQAALSHRLKKLEEELGVALLSRTTRKVSLTSAGLELLPIAHKMIQEVSLSLDGLRQRAKTGRERFAIGCLPTISIVYLPKVLADLKKRYPNLFVQVYDNSTVEIAARVRSGEAEFGVTIVSTDSWDFEITPLIKDPFMLVCPRNHPIAGRPFVTWRELEGQPLIRISTEAGNRLLIDEALGRRREAMTWHYEVQHIATAISLVRAGVGLTVVPRIGIDANDSSGMIAIPIQKPSIARPLGIITRKDQPLSPGAEALIKLISNTLRGSRLPRGKSVRPHKRTSRTASQRSGNGLRREKAAPLGSRVALGSLHAIIRRFPL